MLKRRWRRSSAPAFWAVALTLGAPALVQAQTQLFPLAPIQRPRVPCPMEDPVYGLYRHQYYGYFPTCWRPFPPGWGCPSPEAPNQALEFQRRPRDKPPESLPMDDEPGAGPMPGDAPDMPGGRNPVPPLPSGERSPFEIDNAPNPPGVRPPGNRPRMPDVPPAPELPGGPAPREEGAGVRGTSPFEAPRTAPGRPAGPTGATAPLMSLPDPAEASSSPTPSGPPQALGLDTQTIPGAAFETLGPPAGVIPLQPGSGRPIMSATNATPPPLPNPAVTATANALAPMAGAPVIRPVQAPQRRGPLSTMFSGLTSRLRR